MQTQSVASTVVTAAPLGATGAVAAGAGDPAADAMSPFGGLLDSLLQAAGPTAPLPNGAVGSPATAVGDGATPAPILPLQSPTAAQKQVAQDQLASQAASVDLKTANAGDADKTDAAAATAAQIILIAARANQTTKTTAQSAADAPAADAQTSTEGVQTPALLQGQTSAAPQRKGVQGQSAAPSSSSKDKSAAPKGAYLPSDPAVASSMMAALAQPASQAPTIASGPPAGQSSSPSADTSAQSLADTAPPSPDEAAKAKAQAQAQGAPVLTDAAGSTASASGQISAAGPISASSADLPPPSSAASADGVPDARFKATLSLQDQSAAGAANPQAQGAPSPDDTQPAAAAPLQPAAFAPPSAVAQFTGRSGHTTAASAGGVKGASGSLSSSGPSLTASSGAKGSAVSAVALQDVAAAATTGEDPGDGGDSGDGGASSDQTVSTSTPSLTDAAQQGASFATPIQNTTLPAAQAAAPGVSDTVANLAAQMAQKLSNQTSRFDVQLDPAGLGRVNVSVEIDAKGAVSAALSFEKPEAATLLRAHAGELQQSLTQAGFDVSNATLSFSTADQGGRGGAGQQPFFGGDLSGGNQQGGQGGQAQNAGRAFGAAALAADQTDEIQSTRQSLRARGLDIRI